MSKRFFEDFEEGQEWNFGEWSLNHQEMIDFATEYDPQPIHTDPAAAAQTHFGDIIASGWQTTLKCIRRFVDEIMKDTAGLASPGLEELRWFKPIQAGDRVTARARVISVNDSDSKPDRGRVHFEIFATDEVGNKVMTTNGFFFIAKHG